MKTFIFDEIPRSHIRVIDGDSLEIELPLFETIYRPLELTTSEKTSTSSEVKIDRGFNIYERSSPHKRSCYIVKTLRLHNIDTPELSTEAGKAVKEVVADWVKNRNNFTVFSYKKGVFEGRFIGDIASNGEYLAEYLLDSGLAIKLNKRHNWTKSELEEVVERAAAFLA